MKMKPGPKGVYDFLLSKEGKKAKVTEIIEQLPKLYLKKEKIERWANLHSDSFILDGDQLSINNIM